MTIAPLDLILLLGALQGIILTCLLWFNPRGRRLSNRLLALVMLLLALASLAVGMPVNAWTSLLLDLVPLFIVMPIGPLIYFYTRSLLDADFTLGRRERFHFLPAVLDAGSPVVVWVYLAGTLLGLIPDESRGWWGNLKDTYDIYFDIPRWISLTVYLWLAFRRIPGKAQADTGSSGEPYRHTIRWLRPLLRVLLGFQVVWLMFLVPYVLPALRPELLNALGWYPVYIPITFLIYWMGIRGYIHTQQTFRPAVRKAANSTISPETAEATLHALHKAMRTAQLYLDPELTVEKVARHLDLPGKTISAVLNQHGGKSFNGFINEYRVEEVKKRLLEPGSHLSTLLGIAYDCGFNSQATFGRAFKSVTGMTPKDYLASQRRKLA
jgi:AraC-like DNA-binding protein